LVSSISYTTVCSGDSGTPRCERPLAKTYSSYLRGGQVHTRELDVLWTVGDGGVLNLSAARRPPPADRRHQMPVGVPEPDWLRAANPHPPDDLVILSTFTRICLRAISSFVPFPAEPRYPQFVAKFLMKASSKATAVSAAPPVARAPSAHPQPHCGHPSALSASRVSARPRVSSPSGCSLGTDAK
jgi:hypothetical protein